MLTGVLPAAGTVCKQDTVFSALAAATGSSKALSVAGRRLIAAHGLIDR